jgi:glycosyltransferase involved in cell wall biosynthesis
VPPEKVEVVYNAIDERFWDRAAKTTWRECVSGSSCTSDYVLYVGNIKPHKNLVRLIEAFDGLRRSASTT